MYAIGQQHAGPILWADAAGYISGAQVIASEHVYGLSLIQLNPYSLAELPTLDRVPWWPPGYSAAIAAVSLMDPSDPLRMVFTTHWLNLIGQLVAAAGFGVLAWKGTGRPVSGPLVAALYLLSGPSTYEAPRIVSEHLFMPLVAWAAVAHLKAALTRRPAYIVCAALLWTAAVLTRYNGAVIAGCAGLASLIVARPLRANWRQALAGLAPALVAWAALGLWFARNYAVAGRITGHYAPSQQDAVEQIAETFAAWFLGTSAMPVIPNIAPELRTAIVVWGALMLAIAIVAGAISVILSRPAAHSRQWRWLRAFCATAVPLLLVLLAVAGTRGQLNTIFGRLIMPVVALTLVLVIGAASGRPSLQIPVFLLAATVAAGGFLQIATNVMLPSGKSRLAEMRVLTSSEPIQTAIAGKKVLLVPHDRLTPGVLLVPASVFVPRAEAVYWIDQPKYSGVALSAQRLNELLGQDAFDLVLRGPDAHLPAFEPEGPGPTWLRRQVYDQYATRFKQGIEKLRAKAPAAKLNTETVVRDGAWSVERPIGATEAD
jgi:hypothetical protein